MGLAPGETRITCYRGPNYAAFIGLAFGFALDSTSACAGFMRLWVSGYGGEAMFGEERAYVHRPTV